MRNMTEKMIIRVQSPDGTKRIETSAKDSTSKFYENVRDAFSLASVNFALFKKPNKIEEIISSRSKTLHSYGIKHGDMIFLNPLNGTIFQGNAIVTNSSVTSVNTLHSNVSNVSVIEDDVDVYLQKQDGKIERGRDDRLCQHNQKSKCVHCAPLEPYDEEYLREHNFKHMSFHANLRKLKGGADRGKFAALENISCKIKSGCQDHLPWPRGICSKCQPNAVTLNRQLYRHVDNIVLENPQIAERFLDYWRTTGHQRIGYAFGRYEPHKDVPLGIKATIAAIYEPPQESSRDLVKLLPDEKKDVVDEIARYLGLQRVGWIFTDLIADDLTKGTVKHFRNMNFHFLSAQECIMAGYLQNQHPNPCKLAPDGYFGSKFVTVCVTGDSTNQIHMEGYQVSNQCMALVRDNCLVPTKDAPELGFICESTNEQYVPDVFFKEKDNYGNEVIQLARPLPIEYLLVDVPLSTPMEPMFTFTLNTGIKPFPVENRLLNGHLQEFHALSEYTRQFTPECFLDAASDFHFLIYIATMDSLPLKDYMGPLLDAIKNKDNGLANVWARSEQWQTVEQLMAAQGSPSPSTSQTAFLGASLWTCNHCTFLNQPTHTLCEMCGLPRNAS
uniref:Nuclear protein localization protein 4 homolog n=1 Tax=Strigamia maritima TaxID=126957 RepID=T1IW71_STRMM